ncbi:MAG: hypothetical protein KAQ68_02045 [Clostridiales bacterium]|nr:hypothetical protein [Clostridiales bacterium]
MIGNAAFHISKKSVRIAGDYIMEYGRDIEKIIYQYHFAKESAANVITILEDYCNEDGGISRLEIDSIYTGSMPINCACFFSIVHCLKIKNEFKAIKDTLHYLEKTVNENGSWYSMVPEASTIPHAIWLNCSDQSYQDFNFHPTCEIIGYLYHFGGGDFRSISKTLLDNLYENLLSQPLGKLQRDDLISLMKMCRLISDILAERFISLLEPHLKEALVTDQNQWSNHVLTPLSIFTSPLDPLYHSFEHEITLNLDYDIMHQNDMGYWTQNWDWGQYNKEFESLKSQITANYTLNKLIILKNFKRITSAG